MPHHVIYKIFKLRAVFTITLHFSADTPYYHCNVPSDNITPLNNTIPWLLYSGSDSSYTSGNHDEYGGGGYEESTIKLSPPHALHDSRRSVRSQCTQYMYDNFSFSSDVTAPCQRGYWYDKSSGYDSTIVTEVR